MDRPRYIGLHIGMGRYMFIFNVLLLLARWENLADILKPITGYFIQLRHFRCTVHHVLELL